MATFHERVKAAREHAGLTQGELAKKAGIVQSQISKLELGVRKKSTRTFAIARACGVQPAWLETGQGPMTGGVGVLKASAETEGQVVLEEVTVQLADVEKILRELLEKVVAARALPQDVENVPAASRAGPSWTKVVPRSEDEGGSGQPKKPTSGRGGTRVA